MPKTIVIDRQCSPIMLSIKNSITEFMAVTIFKSMSSNSHNEYQPTVEKMSELLEEKELEMKRAALRVTNYFIDADSKNYIGVSCKWLWIINELYKFSGIPSDNIKLIFMKIKIK